MVNKRTLLRGQIWLANWETPEQPFEEQEITGINSYPVLIISANFRTANEDYPDVVVMPCNVLDEGEQESFYLTIQPTPMNRLPYPVQILGHVFYTIPKILLDSFLGELSDNEMSRIEIMIKKMLALR